MKLKKGDKVKIMVGKDKGRVGQIEKTFPGLNKVQIPGINMYKKHSRGTQGRNGQKAGGIIDIIRPLPASNVSLICPKCGKITRIGYQVLKDEKKRICRKCKEII